MSAPPPVRLEPDMFDAKYKSAMILGYPTIADMSLDQWWFAGPAEKDAAFTRILAAKNLRRTHELYLAEQMEAERDD